jgi:hypothetical protein
VLSRSERLIWKEGLLTAVERLGPEGASAAHYLRRHRTYIGFWKVRKHVGAFWTLPGTIHFNSIHYSYQTELTNIGMLTLLIHEVKHLQQGFQLAFSVYGELEAWQLQFRLYYRFTGAQPHPVIAELMTLPLVYDRAVLKKVVELMQKYAGKGYRADLLPLYPFGREVRYWLARR